MRAMVWSGLVAVLLGGCASPFSTTLYDEGYEPQGLTLRDVDQDGHQDLIITLQLDEEIVVYWGDGQGGFDAPTRFDAGRGGDDVAVGDIDEDGVLDLLHTRQDDGLLTWFPGLGDRAFGEGRDLEQGDFADLVRMGDVDDDGHVDLALHLGDPDCVAVRFGDGTGAFTEAACDYDGFQGVEVADIDGDDDQDLVLLQWEGGAVWTGDLAADGFTDPVSLGAFERVPLARKMKAEDVDADGDQDLYMAARDPDGKRTVVEKLENDGSGNFTSCVAARTRVEDTAVWGTTGDLDGDQLVDVVMFGTCSYCPSTIHVYRNEGLTPECG